ncbi:glycosyltransferase family 39 protein [Candidatus Azambacteria bacterium]|nr:glycosyltransferase family 39 protein [Candidatus Azambacteria bacterium]
MSPSTSSGSKRFWVLVLGILVLAAFMRLWHLPSTPPGLYPDEAMNGVNALEANATGQYKIFYSENNGREGLFINLQALSVAVFGAKPWALRLVSAIVGILTVFGLYLLGKELFSRNVGLWASFFLAIGFWHVNFSRIGFRAIMVPFLLTWALYFWYLGTRKGSAWPFLLSGVAFGLGFHTYIAFRFAPLVMLVPIIQGLRNWLKRRLDFCFPCALGMWLLVAFLVALPIGFYFLQNPQDFLGRAGDVSIFSQSSPLNAAITSLGKTLGQFNIWGDCNWRHNFACHPQLLWPVGLLFLIGFFLILTRRRSVDPLDLRPYPLVLTWLFVMMLPAVFTAEGLPHALRTIGTIPPAFLLAGVGASWLHEKLRIAVRSGRLSKRLLSILLVGFIAALILAEYKKYFVAWAPRPEVADAFTQRFTRIGEYLRDLPETRKKYVIVNENGVLVDGIPMGVLVDGIPMPAMTVKFLTKNDPSVTYLLPEALPTLTTVEVSSVLVPLNPTQKIESKLPPGVWKTVGDFRAFLVSIPYFP